MARYVRQIELTKAAHMASRALADAATVSLEQLWGRYISGDIVLAKYASEVKSVVRFSYREAATVARELTMQLAELPNWEPKEPLKDTDYLESLILDVERNIAEFNESSQDDKAQRKLKLRVELSAVTAAERGFTDAQLEHYGELRSEGYTVRKLWQANFANNDPCIDCVKLSGTVVEFEEEFPVPTLRHSSVYRDLHGPPLHVRCRCVMVVLITRVENLFDRVPTENIQLPTTMTTDSVKRLPKTIFDGIIKLLRAIARRILK